MKPLSTVLAAVLLLALAGNATAINLTPPFFPWTLEYLADHGFSDGCVTLRALPRKPGETATPTGILVHRSSGSAEFDALVVLDLRREIEVLERFPLSSYPGDAAGWRTLPLRLSIPPDRRHRKVLGCSGPGVGR
ncbi:MAG: hypothetical protein ACREO3_07555 [Arenimonas sp.]